MTDKQPPAQSQPYPGRTEPMEPHPSDEMRGYQGKGLLEGKRALVTGGDSGIGRAVAVAFAKEGADVVFGYLSEDADAQRTADLIQEEGRRGVGIRGDLAEESDCAHLVRRTVEELGGIDIVVEHAGTQKPVDDFADLTTEQLRRTFDVNVMGVFWTLREALPHMPDGGSIIVTGSINGLRGNDTLIDYAASKAAAMNLVKSLSQSLMKRRIRVNCVAPGPVWTPLIPATLGEEGSQGFGEQAPMGRAAQPDEIAPSYVFFASDRLSSFYTGQTLAPVGGEIQPS
ncbi:SDR family oxidoreductase [Nocardiopsis algeriensis]|uniref:NAD(P)-dependent dehydrogenase (Short-subunit alcohol dehydrogenase family) n=1 Tax=Nocardiopsis algeriensis TaxID=1478215 RepID=A0A841IUH8_9ACTN|nr:SDR family oxidoreductase [Nocardiopsis algeriensis]MBB6121900.1 NAD(P)-dependent dehydrogenase (short-subunit alcohol dehydrogenase family) [Nocardiopsis algeriensis]